MLNLRKKILERTKIKTLNGKALDGAMLGQLLTSYVESINTGAVPNIENAWTYICRNQTQQALDKCFEEFNAGLDETLDTNWPVSNHFLKTLYTDLRDTAIQRYKKEAVGESFEQKLNSLVHKMEDKYEQLVKENKREYETKLTYLMTNNYQTIQRKLAQNEYKSVYDFEQDLRAFKDLFQNSEPHGPNKTQLISEFLNLKLPEGYHHFYKELSKENERVIVKLKQDKS